MNQLPTLKTQLRTGSGTESRDCAPVTIINAILWASDGKVGPQNQNEVGKWVKKVRVWAHNLHNPFLTQRDCMRAYAHPELQYLFKLAGFKPLRVRYYHALPWDDFRKSLSDGYAVHLSLDYGILRRSSAPTASRTFSGGHSVLLVGYEKRKRYVYTNDGDPLFDGRRADVPKGYQLARFRSFKSASGAFGAVNPGYGKATVIVVGKGQKNG